MIRDLLRRAKHTLKGAAALHTIPTLNERAEPVELAA